MASARRFSIVAPNRARTARSTRRVEMVAIAGEISNRNESNILFGKVTDRVPQIKSATINSSKEIIKANKAPAKTPGWIKG